MFGRAPAGKVVAREGCDPRGEPLSVQAVFLFEAVAVQRHRELGGALAGVPGAQEVGAPPGLLRFTDPVLIPAADVDLGDPVRVPVLGGAVDADGVRVCLLYTSDAADE